MNELMFYYVVICFSIIILGLLFCKFLLRRACAEDEIGAVVGSFAVCYWGIAFLVKDIKDVMIGSIIFTFMIIDYPEKEKILKLIEHIGVVVVFSYVFKMLCVFFLANFFEREWFLLFTIVSMCVFCCWRKGVIPSFLYKIGIVKK